MAANQRRKQAATVGPDQLIRLEGSSSSKRGTEGNFSSDNIIIIMV